jgi:hypothetical protein
VERLQLNVNLVATIGAMKNVARREMNDYYRKRSQRKTIARH